MADLPGLTLTPHLDPSSDPQVRDEAVRLLQGYYAGLLGTGKGFEGGWWDGFDPSRTRGASPDVFTVDDLLSASLLSAPIYSTAVLEILGEKANRLSSALKDLGDDRDLGALSAGDVQALEKESTLWATLRAIPGIGSTRASKLVARKRPRLVPIYDEVVGAAVYGKAGSRGQWQRLHAVLTADGNALQEHLGGLRTEAGLPEWISLLRIFDVIAWLDGSGKSHGILNPKSPPKAADLEAILERRRRTQGAL